MVSTGSAIHNSFLILLFFQFFQGLQYSCIVGIEQFQKFLVAENIANHVATDEFFCQGIFFGIEFSGDFDAASFREFQQILNCRILFGKTHNFVFRLIFKDLAVFVGKGKRKIVDYSAR